MFKVFLNWSASVLNNTALEQDNYVRSVPCSACSNFLLLQLGVNTETYSQTVCRVCKTFEHSVLNRCLRQLYPSGLREEEAERL